MNFDGSNVGQASSLTVHGASVPRVQILVSHVESERAAGCRPNRQAGSLTHILLLACLAFPLLGVAADQPPVPPEKGAVDATGKFTPRAGPPSGKPAPPESAIKPLGDGKLKIGDVVLDQSTRTVMIPAKVNMPEGVVEYALVMESGKAHESIFTTRATAEHIHIACMLLGLNAARMGAGEDVPAESAVKIEVAWDSNGPERRIPLSDCVALAEGSPDKKTGKTLPAGPWFYAGSQIDAGGFAATREGSIISVISDSTALINNPHQSRFNDGSHHANATMLPRKGLPVRIILTLPPAKKPLAPAEQPAAATKETPAK